jgi:hypothetical protein
LFKLSPENDITEVEEGVVHGVLRLFAILLVKIYHRGNDVLSWIIIHESSTIKLYDQFFVKILLQLGGLNYICETKFLHSTICHKIVLHLEHRGNYLSKF